MKNEELKLNRFLEKAYNKYGDLYDYSKVKYKDNKTIIKILCKIHGEFSISPDNFLNKSKCGCPRCGEMLRGLSKKSNTQEFINKAILVHSAEYDYSLVDYKGAHKKVNIICYKHGDFWQDAANHLSGHKCPKCADEKSGNKQRMSQYNFLERCKEVHKNKYDYSKVEYKGSYIPITIICHEHGEFIQQPVVHLQGCGCVKCRLKNQNKLYELLKNKFSNEEILWEYSPEWLGKQRFDISIPKYNIAVEYNGRQHYVPVEKFGGKVGFEKTKQRDIIKKDKCKLHNWTIFDIKYDYTEYDYKLLVSSIQLKIKNSLHNKLCLD